jgi:DNA invertase Pin-like site-specific DNA recombinase
MRAVAYLRVSTTEQAESGLGLDAQRAAVLAECERMGATLDPADVFVDEGVSGGAELEDCPALVAALDAIEDGAALVVAKRDRLGRDVYRLALIERMAERAGARIVSADGTGNGDDPAALLMRRMVDAFAEYERALIRSRTSAALRAKVARGEHVGRPRYGWRVEDGELVAIEDEQAVIREAVQLRAQGLTLRAVSAALADAGMVSRTGRPFGPSQVRSMTRAA